MEETWISARSSPQLLGSLTGRLVGSHILHPLTRSVPGSSATETSGASRTLNSGQHVRQLFVKPELLIKVGQKKVIPLCRKILNMWYSFFHKAESLLGDPFIMWILNVLLSGFFGISNVTPFSHSSFSLPSVIEQCLWLNSTFTNEILKC